MIDVRTCSETDCSFTAPYCGILVFFLIFYDCMQWVRVQRFCAIKNWLSKKRKYFLQSFGFSFRIRKSASVGPWSDFLHCQRAKLHLRVTVSVINKCIGHYSALSVPISMPASWFASRKITDLSCSGIHVKKHVCLVVCGLIGCDFEPLVAFPVCAHIFFTHPGSLVTVRRAV